MTQINYSFHSTEFIFAYSEAYEVLKPMLIFMNPGEFVARNALVFSHLVAITLRLKPSRAETKETSRKGKETTKQQMTIYFY